MAKGPQITIEAKGAVKAGFDLHQLGVRARDVRPLSTKVQAQFRASTKGRFESRGRGSWPPLAESTRARKADEGQRPEVLRMTDKLFRSLTVRGAEGSVQEAKPNEIVYGTRLRYAHLAQKTEHQPLRKIVELRPSEQREITKLIQTYIAKGEK